MRSFPLASTLQTSLATWMDSLRPPAQECSSSSEPDDLSRDGVGPRISSRAARKSARADTLRRCNDPICRQWLGVSCNLFQNCEKQREPEPTASSISWTLTIARRSRQRSLPRERHVVDSNAPSARDDSPRDLRDTAPSPARSRVSSEEESRRFRNGGEPRVDHVVYVLVGLCDVPRNGHGTTPGHPRHRG